MTKTSNIELWADGEMIGRGFAALEPLPSNSARTAAEMRMFRTELRAVEAEQQRADAIAARDAALEERKLAEAVVNQAHISLARQLCERADTLGRRMDAFARKRNREFLDSLPDPDNANPGGELSPIGPTGELEPQQPAGVGADSTDVDDQIPEPKDPSGTSLEL
jgi:hypothetical protein